MTEKKDSIDKNEVGYIDEDFVIIIKEEIVNIKDIPLLNEIKKGLCPKCGSKKIYRYGNKMTSNGKVQRYQCQKCGYVWSNDNE